MNLFPYRSPHIKIWQFVTDFFTKGNERTLLAKKNIAASFLIKGISIVISLVLVPLTINYINPTQYGIWLTLSSIVAWFSFFDIGFGNGLRNKLAEAKGKGNTTLAQSYISTTYAVFTIIFTLVWLLFFISYKSIDWVHILNAKSEINSELGMLALIIFSYFCLQFVLKTINIVLTADQKPARAALIDMLGQAFSLLIIIILTKTTKGSLVNLGLSLGIAPIIVLIISSIWFYKREYNKFYPSLKKINFIYAKDIMGIGVKFFIVQVAALVIYQTNNIIIAHTCGSDVVTVFNIAYKYFGILSMIFIIIITPFWSAFTDAYVQNDTIWMASTLRKLKTIWLYIAIGGIFMLVFSKYFFQIWIGNKVYIPIEVSALMLVYFLVFTRFSLFINLLNGTGKIALQLIFNLILAIVNIPLIWILGSKYGLQGILIGNIIISLPHAIYSQIQLKKIIGNTAIGIWNK